MRRINGDAVGSQPVEVLHDEWVVETELLAHERLVARGGVLAEENGHDVAAEHVDQPEDHHRTDESCEQHREQRAQCVSQHRCVI